jgi:hypothetical protein
MTHPARFTALFLLVSTAIACGGKSFDVHGTDPDEGGSSSQGGSSSVAGKGGTSSAAGKGSGGVIGRGGAASAGSGSVGGAQGGRPADACDAYVDDAGTYLPVEIVNQTTGTIYLGAEQATCGSSPLFQVENDAGIKTFAPDCRAPCNVVRKEGAVACPGICRAPYATALVSGQSLVTSWDALDYVGVKMPKACVVAPNGAAECVRATRIDPGAFTFSARASSEVSCKDWTATGTCESCPPGSLSCEIQGAMLTGTLRTASTSVVLDGSFGIFPKAAPAPGQAPPDADVPASPVIRIVFTD